MVPISLLGYMREGGSLNRNLSITKHILIWRHYRYLAPVCFCTFDCTRNV